jgi:hypothetical protein
MSTVHFSFVEINAYSQGGKPVDCPSSKRIGTPEPITSDGSNKVTTLAATDVAIFRKPGTLFWRIANMGTDNIYVSFGLDPTASATTGYGIPAGAVDFFMVSEPGEKAAVTNA